MFIVIIVNHRPQRLIIIAAIVFVCIPLPIRIPDYFRPHDRQFYRLRIFMDFFIDKAKTTALLTHPQSGKPTNGVGNPGQLISAQIEGFEKL